MAKAMGWAALGKPDYSHVAKLVERFPAEVKNQWNLSQLNVLKRTIFYSWYATYYGGRNSPLASFSESTLGKAFGKSRWTVMRALAKLEESGLLKRIRRPPLRPECYQTNQILLGSKLLAMIFWGCGKSSTKSPCSKSAPQEVGNVYKRDRVVPFETPPPVSRQGKDSIWDGKSLVSSVLAHLQRKKQA